MERPRISAIVTKDSGRASRWGLAELRQSRFGWYIWEGFLWQVYDITQQVYLWLELSTRFGSVEMSFFFGPSIAFVLAPTSLPKALTSKRGID